MIKQNNKKIFKKKKKKKKTLVEDKLFSEKFLLPGLSEAAEGSQFVGDQRGGSRPPKDLMVGPKR